MGLTCPVFLVRVLVDQWKIVFNAIYTQEIKKRHMSMPLCFLFLFGGLVVLVNDHAFAFVVCVIANDVRLRT